MLAEALDYLRCGKGDVIVDCTLGGGGHSMAILQEIGKSGKLIGIDTDEYALETARNNLARFSQQTVLVKERYENVASVLETLGIHNIDGALLDLGTSAYQLQQKERGFSYQQDNLLDMRMDVGQKLTAKDIVNDYPEAEMTRIFKKYGEERWASRIAKFIAEKRKISPVETTFQLVEIIKAAIPASARRTGGHPAKRVFQALRIEVNKELTGLEKTIKVIVKSLSKNKRIAVLTYHSLEDRITKRTMKELQNDGIATVLTKKPVLPSKAEIATNPSARSAKLRAAERV